MLLVLGQMYAITSIPYFISLHHQYIYIRFLRGIGCQRQMSMYKSGLRLIHETGSVVTLIRCFWVSCLLEFEITRAMDCKAPGKGSDLGESLRLRLGRLTLYFSMCTTHKHTTNSFKLLTYFLAYVQTLRSQFQEKWKFPYTLCIAHRNRCSKP